MPLQKTALLRPEQGVRFSCVLHKHRAATGPPLLCQSSMDRSDCWLVTADNTHFKPALQQLYIHRLVQRALCMLHEVHACNMEDFKLELGRSDENTVYYELHPADPGET